MKPVVALVGRPNVGKSTLFNRLTSTRDALVADIPGLTRDRQYGSAQIDGMPIVLIDTGGLYGEDGKLSRRMESQVQLAIEEADLALFLVDARQGMSTYDEEIVRMLRKKSAQVVLVINKIDGVNNEALYSEFSRLGFGEHAQISATHGMGMQGLRELLSAKLPDPVESAEEIPVASGTIRIAVLGRPNVGKSTLVNRLIKEERQVVFDEPGTTRDSISIPFEQDGQPYILVDTAGVRRKGKVSEIIEKFSVVKTLQALDRSDVAVLVIDASEGLVDQDLHLFRYAVEAGTGIVLAINKWDGLNREHRDQVLSEIERKLVFAPWMPRRRISALHGTGVGELLVEIQKVYKAGMLDSSTSALTRLLNQAVAEHPPPSIRGRRIKLRFAHKVGQHPPQIVIHGNQTEDVPVSYTRYLENYFRKALRLSGTPIQIFFKTAENPYAGKSNDLTGRQKARRKRMLTHVKKKERNKKRR
ncbi:MAG: ribosome biogenesis GTPase Der [Pseudomonadales bacterium]|nr:ribosome biogenesis GTPase Der [Pseudomonadales bacterium]